MNTATQIARHLREVHFGGNWTAVNLKDTLNSVTWQEATTHIHGFNTIATLVYHINYYVVAVMNVLKGTPLDAKDAYSFSHPPVNNANDWEQLQQQVHNDVTSFAELVEQLPDSKLPEIFVHEKYGSYYRNLHGIIEHTHYHLGQITLIKKLLRQG